MLSPYHVRLLKKISDGNVVRESTKDRDLEYLYKQGYITMMVYEGKDEDFCQPIITERGKARLYQWKRERFWYWIPIVFSNMLSIAALLVSLFD